MPKPAICGTIGAMFDDSPTYPRSTVAVRRQPRHGLAALALGLAGCTAGGAGVSLNLDDDVGLAAPSDGAPGDIAGPGRIDAGRGDARPREGGADDARGGRFDARTDADPDPVPPDPTDLTVVTLNVGTLNLADPIYLRHISNQAYEDFIGARLRTLGADLVALQGLLPPIVCSTANETDPARTCFESNLRPTQAERLLGPDYQVVCDAVRGVTCLGVHRRVGIPPTAVRQTASAPLPPCSVGANACDEAHCDEDSSVTRLALDTPGGPILVVFFLLSGPGRGAGGFYTGQSCRAPQVEQLFEPAGTLGSEPLLVGDLAFDPGTLLAGASGMRLAARLQPVGPFTDLAPRDAAGRRAPTETSIGAAQDTVLVANLTGTCEVVGDPTFDLGFDFDALPGGTEDAGRITHLGVRCRLRSPSD